MPLALPKRGKYAPILLPPFGTQPNEKGFRPTYNPTTNAFIATFGYRGYFTDVSPRVYFDPPFEEPHILQHPEAKTVKIGDDQGYIFLEADTVEISDQLIVVQFNAEAVSVSVGMPCTLMFRPNETWPVWFNTLSAVRASFNFRWPSTWEPGS